MTDHQNAVPHHWKGLDERDGVESYRESLASEFPAAPDGTAALLEAAKMSGDLYSRRSFLKAAGFSIAGGVLGACSRPPARTAIPLLAKPPELTAGRPYWYASTCGGCGAKCGILVKNRDGRPIKIEGNPDHPLSRGGLCAVGQATVLGLYDSQRLQKPLLDGREVEWPVIDDAMRGDLAILSDNVYFLTGTVTSPTTRALIAAFLARFDNGVHVEYDPVSYSAILDAHEQTFGVRVLPRYRFDRAHVIVSFDADFLGTWVSPVEFTKGYADARSLDGNPPRLSRHVQFEGRLSLTGSNADQRIQATPAECRAAMLSLAERLERRTAGPASPRRSRAPLPVVDEPVLDEIAERLWAARGRSLVVCGQNDVAAQRLVNRMNHVLGNYGETLDIVHPSRQWNGNDRAVLDLVDRMLAGRVNAIFVADVNPAYSLPNAEAFVDGLKKVPLSVALTEQPHETAALTRYVCPVHHFLESWDDAELVSSIIGLAQPAIAPLCDTRSPREMLSSWLGDPRPDVDILKAYWRRELFPRQDREASFERFWDRAVHDGWAELGPAPVRPGPFADDRKAGADVALAPDAYALVLYEKPGMRDGRHAHNPWLHELPDPITKAVWDNYVCLAPGLARRLKVEQGQVVRVTAGSATIALPALIQPGQHEEVLAIALGYGRRGTDRFSRVGPHWIQAVPTVRPGDTIGRNAFPLATIADGSIRLENVVSIAPTGERGTLATTQTHHSIVVPEGLGGDRRDVVRETTLAAFLQDPASGNRREQEIQQLWQDDFPYEGHRWGMVIDLNRCTGCSACVVGCQAENNVPVVGKDEVYRRREMHWIRLDRYYSGDDHEVDVLHQPVMCQHCGNAPCESVCPVLATVHSEDGLNQQVYNRCIGTRYCANNCPYRVRRFNWFDYRPSSRRENLVLNPDVTVRTRGVMEKCSLCVQRIRLATAEAKRAGRPVRDGEIKVACEQSCPGDAIVFGDLNDPASRVSRLSRDPRHYHVLSEMNFKPAIGYLTKVRHRPNVG